MTYLLSDGFCPRRGENSTLCREQHLRRGLSARVSAVSLLQVWAVRSTDTVEQGEQSRRFCLDRAVVCNVSIKYSVWTSTRKGSVTACVSTG